MKAGHWIIRNVAQAKRKRLVAHVSRAVRGKSKGSAPAKRTCTSAAQLVYLLAHLKRQAESAIAKQQAWDAQDQGDPATRANQLPIHTTSATGKIHGTELRWSLEHNFEHLDPIIQFRKVRLPPKAKGHTSFPPRRRLDRHRDRNDAISLPAQELHGTSIHAALVDIPPPQPTEPPPSHSRRTGFLHIRPIHVQRLLLVRPSLNTPSSRNLTSRNRHTTRPRPQPLTRKRHQREPP